MIIDGKLHSEKLRKKIKDELTKLCQNTQDVPKLSVILIGDYLPSQIYVKNKQKKAKEVGIKSEVIKYPETVSEKEILDKIKSLNNDKEVTGILVQLPLPKQINQKKIINTILTDTIAIFYSIRNINLSINTNKFKIFEQNCC